MDSFKERFPHIPDRIFGLGELAFNLWWSWHPEARMLFKMLDRTAWKVSVHNPVKMLHYLDKSILDAASKDAKFLRHYDAVMSRFRAEMQIGCNWFYNNVSDPGKLPIAYFSAEYGLQHSLPFYAGGLGFLAGDFLKECSDLCVPVIAIGFMYPEGYFRQKIKPDGWQESENEIIDRENAPIFRVYDDQGNRLGVKVPIIDPPIYVEVWKVQIGKISLYLIDTDIELNDPWNRGISSHLYIAGPELRLRQEIVLGIGGAQVLNALGIRHSVLHLNEGHPAFAILERIRERVDSGMSYGEAVEQVRATTVFTTHTPVSAGHDVFPFSMIEKYFSGYWSSLGLDRDAFMRLGMNPDDPSAGFNMTVFAMRMSEHRYAVSRRHGEITRKMFHSLWPDKSVDDVPITHVTNGIHIPTWISPKLELLLNRYLGSDWLNEQDVIDTWRLVEDIPDEEIWQTHYWMKMKLIITIMERARRRWHNDRVDPQIVLASGVMLDPNVLTLGFARRFATYKRADLILQNAERLQKILNDRWRPVQIIFAGKAHPDDNPGKLILQTIFNTARDPFFGGRIAFVEDYDEQFAQYLVHGVDVWLNNPLPPFEACGTSGMKASLNGIPHLSILDGWWIEGYNGRNGWAFGGQDGGDKKDGEAIYDILEREVIPLFYRTDDGIPHDWVKVMKEAMISVAPLFSSRRMVKEYVMKFYQDALKAAV